MLTEQSITSEDSIVTLDQGEANGTDRLRADDDDNAPAPELDAEALFAADLSDTNVLTRTEEEVLTRKIARARSRVFRSRVKSAVSICALPTICVNRKTAKASTSLRFKS